MNNPKSERDYTRSQEKYNKNSTHKDPHFEDLFQEIVSLVSTPEFNKRQLRNLLQKFGSSRQGKLFVRLIPHINIPNKSYRNLGRKTDISHEQIRQWVYQYGPELLEGGER